MADTPPVQQADPQTIREWMLAGKVTLVDVREPDEYAVERISGAMLNPLSQFDPTRIPSLPGKVIVIYCRSGNRCGTASQLMVAAGRVPVTRMTGGINAWREAGLPTEK